VQECGFAGLTAFARSYCGDRDGLGWAGLGVELEVEWGVWMLELSVKLDCSPVHARGGCVLCCVVSCWLGYVESCVGELSLYDRLS